MIASILLLSYLETTGGTAVVQLSAVLQISRFGIDCMVVRGVFGVGEQGSWLVAGIVDELSDIAERGLHGGVYERSDSYGDASLCGRYREGLWG